MSQMKCGQCGAPTDFAWSGYNHDTGETRLFPQCQTCRDAQRVPAYPTPSEVLDELREVPCQCVPGDVDACMTAPRPGTYCKMERCEKAEAEVRTLRNAGVVALEAKEKAEARVKAERTSAFLQLSLAQSKNSEWDSIQYQAWQALKAERDQAIADLREEKARLDWRPIETAPKDGTEITGGWEGSKPFTSSGTPIVWQISGRRSGWFALSPTYENDEGEFFPGKWLNERDYPTHWRPLMDPPDAARAAESTALPGE